MSSFPLSPEREICDILLLSFIQTKWNQLSTDFVGPPFFQERSIVSHASVNQLLHACLLTKWKKCNILSLFLQIHIVESTIPRRSSVPLSLQKGAAYGMLPICKAFVCLPFYKRSFHIPLQSPWGGYAAFERQLIKHTFLHTNIQHSTFHHSLKRMVPLSLQNGKRFACFH